MHPVITVVLVAGVLAHCGVVLAGATQVDVLHLQGCVCVCVLWGGGRVSRHLSFGG